MKSQCFGSLMDKVQENNSTDYWQSFFFIRIYLFLNVLQFYRFSTHSSCFSIHFILQSMSFLLLFFFWVHNHSCTTSFTLSSPVNWQLLSFLQASKQVWTVWWMVESFRFQFLKGFLYTSSRMRVGIVEQQNTPQWSFSLFLHLWLSTLPCLLFIQNKPEHFVLPWCIWQWFSHVHSPNATDTPS